MSKNIPNASNTTPSRSISTLEASCKLPNNFQDNSKLVARNQLSTSWLREWLGKPSLDYATPVHCSFSSELTDYLANPNWFKGGVPSMGRIWKMLVEHKYKSAKTMIESEHIIDETNSSCDALKKIVKRSVNTADASRKLLLNFWETSTFLKNLNFSASLKNHSLPNTQPRGIHSKHFLYRWIAFHLGKFLANS